MTTHEGNFDIEYFLTHVMNPLLSKVLPHGRKSHALRLNLHLDNCWVHSLNALKQSLMKILSLPFVTLHTVLEPSDFWHSGPISAFLADRVFSDVNECVFQHQTERIEWV
jgi:hypothetical protein